MKPHRISKSGLKTLQALEVLKDHVLTGISAGEISRRLKEPPANINRYLNTLMTAGYARRREDGLYSLDCKILEFSQAYMAETHRITSMMTEINQRLVK